jgi:hypothetical protein
MFHSAPSQPADAGEAKARAKTTNAAPTLFDPAADIGVSLLLALYWQSLRALATGENQS